MTAGTTTDTEHDAERLPVALGYVRRYPWMTDIELDIVERRLGEVARQHGRTLGTIHIEFLHTEPRAFKMLLAALEDSPSAAVIVPTKAHLGRWDRPESKYYELRQATGAEVIVADVSP